MPASQNRFAPELNEKEVIELLENATSGSIKKANLRSGVPFVFVGSGKERLIQLLDYSSAAP